MTKNLLHCLIVVSINSAQVVDGDSLRNVTLDLGLGVSITRHLRLMGIDAPEMSEKPAGQRAKEALTEVIGFCSDLKVEQHGYDSFGRVLVTLYCGKRSINKMLLDKGFAVPYRKGH